MGDLNVNLDEMPHNAASPRVCTICILEKNHIVKFQWKTP